jgi:hypothetical protein
MTTKERPMNIPRTPLTVADCYAVELGNMADALERRDWDEVQVVARHLKVTTRMIETYGGDADYVQATLGHKVIR